MRYIDRLLDSDEEVAYRARVSKTTFVPGGALIAAAVIALAAGSIGAAVALFAIGAAAIVYAAIRTAGTEFVVTNKRVMARVATSRGPPWAVPLDQITEVRADRGAVAGLLRSGTLRVRDVTDTVRSVGNLAAPGEIVEAIESRRMAASRA